MPVGLIEIALALLIGWTLAGFVLVGAFFGAPWLWKRVRRAASWDIGPHGDLSEGR